MRVSRKFLKPVPEGLYEQYPGSLVAKQLSLDVMGEETKEIEGVCLYLKDKGLVVESEAGWRITALGIDFLEEKNLV